MTSIAMSNRSVQSQSYCGADCLILQLSLAELTKVVNWNFKGLMSQYFNILAHFVGHATNGCELALDSHNALPVF